ncbi:MAG TPA: hypothetical protein VFV33_10415 [Gemmatimonadaceae bacterium]|nr:hypothetical protein [Gemmatimonadaceae bacterium]
MRAWARSVPAVAGGVVLLALAAPAGAAQESNDTRCRAATVWDQSPATFGALAGRHPRQAVARLEGLVERDAWVAIVDSVTADFVRGTPPELPEASRAAMLRQLGALRDSLRRAELRGIADDRRRLDIVQPNAFRPVQEGTGEDYTLFEDPDEVAIPSTLPAAASRHLCWTAITVLQLLNVYSAPAYAQAATELQRLDALWDNFTARGYSRLPWEMALNDRLFMRKGALEPPRTQLILLHPSVAFEVRGPTAKSLVRDEVAVIEPLGVAFYNAARTFHYGASLAVSFPKSAPAGVGGMVHLGKHLTFGYVWRSADSSGTRRDAFVASIDAYTLFAKAPEALVKAKAAAGVGARIRIAELLGKPPQ